MKKEIEKYKSFKIYEYARIGDVSYLEILHFKVYKRVGNARSLFGYVWGSNK